MALKNYIEFKGTKDGLIIYLNEASEFENIKEQLIEKLEKTKNFFKGARVAAIQGKSLSKNEEDEIIDIINNQFGMIMVEKEINRTEIESIEENKVFDGLEVGITKFIKNTLRSGAKVEFEGNVVIMGDVNPGAEVKAYGNIIVIGTLRGMAHAGANGNDKAFVTALKLIPTQLRIATYIARSPDSSFYKPKYPEIALVKNNMIIIEPYLTKKR